jgi:dipeptidase
MVANNTERWRVFWQFISTITDVVRTFFLKSRKDHTISLESENRVLKVERDVEKEKGKQESLLRDDLEKLEDQKIKDHFKKTRP